METKIVTGTTEPGNALFSAIIPATWNGNLLLVAHGFRPETSAIEADFSNLNVRLKYIKSLASQGWVVAITSFRRNGWIMDDAIEDLNLLYDKITSIQSKSPSKVFLIGDSMGGAISAKICEKGPDHKVQYNGAVLVGAALHHGDPNDLNHKPRCPMIFLTNQSETEGPEQYIQKVVEEEKKGEGIVRSVLWKILRNGHVNVNSFERETAVLAVADWSEKGSLDGAWEEKVLNGWGGVAAGLDSDHAGGKSKVIEKDIYGNLILDFTKDQLERLYSIRLGDKFSLRKRGAVKIDGIVLGEDFGSVKSGEWVGFIHAEGYLFICKNGSNAAKEFQNAKAGELLFIAKEG